MSASRPPSTASSLAQAATSQGAAADGHGLDATNSVPQVPAPNRSGPREETPGQTPSAAPDPAAASSTATSSTRWPDTRAGISKLRQWVTGRDLSSTMQIDLDPAALTMQRAAWETEWTEAEMLYREDAWSSLQGLGRGELRERMIRVESELERIRSNLAQLHPKPSEAQVRVGCMIVFELIEECQPTLMNILASTSRDATGFERPQIIEEIKTIERVYDFVLFCTAKLTRLQWKTSGVLPPSANQQISKPDSLDEAEILHREWRATPPIDVAATGVASHDLNFFRSEEIGPGRLYGRRPKPARSQMPGVPLALEPVTVVSSSQSHKQNLAGLIGISFFGASITWSTIFSGTRGNLLLIAWSACLFIVAAVCASSATLLVFPEDLLTTYTPVRWTRSCSLI
ncbi:hypothetical protein HMN09_01306600 [Mycena chlorophos]|uniref:Uncharacterized protein n=1 Tax=Mycena chlorophos TaxID=658473 RepID=A0A8H6S0E0_MYCCL|nr:hypothetical protein HMN09_01306600 [Mycena chlorophos]